MLLATVATAALLLLAAVSPDPSRAFDNHVPFAWWALSPSAAASVRSVKMITLNALELKGTVEPAINQCPKVVVIFDQPGLHASDFKRLPGSSAFKEVAAQATASILVDYVPGGVSVDGIVSRLEEQCKADVIEKALTDFQNFELDPNVPTVVVVMRGNTGEQLSRVDEVAQVILASVESAVINEYSVVLTASRPGSLHLAGWERSLPEGISRKLVKRATNGTGTGSPATSSNGGLFGIFVIFGPGIWMGLFAVSIFLPILFSAVLLITGIQTPLRFEKKPKNIK